MKTPEQVRSAVTRRLKNSWSKIVAGESAWNPTIPLGRVTSAEIARDWAGTVEACRVWTQACHQVPGLTTDTTKRSVGGVRIEVPTHAHIDFTDAARWAGPPWPQAVERAYARKGTINEQFPGLETPSWLIAAVAAEEQMTDADMDVTVAVGRWFAEHDARGMTPRQVPVPGMHSKWLKNHRRVIEHLSGKHEGLGLVERPNTVDVTYVDPDHRARGGRHHDRYTIGDPGFALPYSPTLAVVVENADSRLFFPARQGTVVVGGAGMASASSLARTPWLSGVPILYWGDIDYHGFCIVNAIRASGMQISTVCMDMATVRRYRVLGGDDPGQSATGARRPEALLLLTADERAVVDIITADDYTGPRRIEQERIPFSEALTRIEEAARSIGT